ncbi:sulfite exporter TauE/SafE family protein 3-like [Glycine soja]|uniref:sulfite exporter TauE/SafE family protein 3-like n=1 Tax=Glycine soja TaxID=3848 RepID=UPI001040BD95|nr:sulfite exporter TauE/SafE family protein 3-like [Glycine soja]
MEKGNHNKKRKLVNILYQTVAIIENVYWKEFGLLVFVWVSFPALQIGKENYTTTCPTFYWALNLLQGISSLLLTSWFAAL